MTTFAGLPASFSSTLLKLWHIICQFQVTCMGWKHPSVTGTDMRKVIFLAIG